MVQMEDDGNGGILTVLLHRVGNVSGSLLLVLQCPVGKIHTTAHERVGQVRALQDSGGAEGLVHFNDSLGLCHSIDVECSLSIIMSFGGLHEGLSGTSGIIHTSNVSVNYFLTKLTNWSIYYFHRQCNLE